MAIIFSDDFARSDRNLIGDNGWAGWGSGTYACTIVSGRARQTGTNPTAKQSHGSRTQVAIETTLDRTGSAFETNLLLKSASGSSDPGDAWMGYVDNGTVRICNGWSTIFGSEVSNTHTPGDRYRFGLVESGGSTTLSVWKNGTLLTSVTTGSVKTGTWCGVHAGSSGSTTHHFDDFQIHDTASPTPAGPTANAGSDQSVITGAAVTLSGSATGGTAPYSYAWTQLSGTTVTLSSASAQSPTFTAPGTGGTLTFRLTVTDAASQTSTDDVSITVTAPVAPTIITTGALNPMQVGTAFSQTVAATGTTPITWAVVSGALPAGLSLNTSTGAITGTPTTAGTGTVGIRASNTAGTDTDSFTWTVTSVPTIAPTDANIVYAPGVWNISGGVASSKDKNAYLVMLLEATEATINVTLPALHPSQEWQQWGYRVNRGPWQMFTYGPAPAVHNVSQVVDFATANKYWGRNLLEIVYAPQFDAWTKGAFQFRGITVNSGAQTRPMSSNRWKGMVLGSSIVRGSAAGGTQGTNGTDLLEGWAWRMKDLGPWELGIVGKGSQGIFQPGVGTSGDALPDLRTTVDLMWDGVPRSFAGIDFVVLLCRGAGESAAAAIGAGFATIVAKIRATAGSIPILWLPHRTGDADPVADIAGAQNYAATDPNFHVVDDSTWPALLPDGSPDTGHRYGWWDNAIYAPLVASQVMEVLAVPQVIYVEPGDWPPAADPDPLHFYARVT